MNSIIRCSTLLAAALCTALVAGCNAVEDVPSEATAPPPAETAVLGGNIENLGTRRALVLQLVYDNAEVKLCRELNTATNVQVPVECRLYGIPDQRYSPFNFGSLPVGKPYTMSVKTQPFSKTCLFKNGTTSHSGTLRSGAAPDIEINCTDTTPPAHYTVTANISAAARNKPGLKVTLNTENGTCPVEVNGRAQIVFSPSECPNVGPNGWHQSATFLFDNGVNLPNFTWRVTATIPGATVVDPPTNCVVTGDAGSRTVPNTGGNIADDGTADRTLIPNANQAVTVSACGFVINVQADYSLSSAETVVPTIAAGDDIKVVLRSQPWGEDVAVASIPNFAAANVTFKVPDANGEPTGTDYEVKSNPSAYYEAVVTKSPAGMSCVLGSSNNSGSGANSNTRVLPATATSAAIGAVAAKAGGAVLVRYPSSDLVQYKWILNKVVRCRLIAVNPIPLRGTYWQHRKTTTIATVAGVATTTVTYVRARNLLTFFEDGQYLFGSRTNTASSNGPEHGFYLYTPTARTKSCRVDAGQPVQPANSICFVAFTDINGGGTSGLTGLHGLGSTNFPIPRQLTNVVRSTTEVVPGVVRKTITASWSDTTTGGVALVAAVADPATPASLTVTAPLGTFDVAAGTHTTVTTLVNAINAVANPGGSSAANVAVAAGNEIQIRGLAGGVSLSGPAVATLGLPASVAAGQVAVSTGVGAALGTNTRTIVDLVLEEVGPDPMVTTSNLMDGAWVSVDWQRQPVVQDPRRVLVFQHGLYALSYIGVNGLPNMQDTCFTGSINDLSGSLVRQRGSGTSPVDLCHLRQITLLNGETLQQVLEEQLRLTGRDADCNIFDVAVGNLTSTCIRLGGTAGDVPNSTLSPPLDRDHPARFPQTMSPGFDTRYSFVDYEVRPANSAPSDPVCPTVDKLTFWDTQNGVRKDTLVPAIPRLVFCRLTAN
jgi:hypothetical protein